MFGVEQRRRRRRSLERHQLRAPTPGTNFPGPGCHLAVSLQDDSDALWRELSAELPELEGQLARAAAAAAHELARGAPLPANTAEAVRSAMPSLLSIQVYLPGKEADWSMATAGSEPAGRKGQEEGAGGVPGGASGTEVQVPLHGGGSCAFVLSQTAGGAERLSLDMFCQELGRHLQRARQHLAKQRLEVGLPGQGV